MATTVLQALPSPLTLLDALGALAAAVAILAPIAAGATWVYRRLIWTRRLVSSDDGDLDEAFLLYERRVGDVRVRDSSEDIRRWLDETRTAEARGAPDWIEFLIVAKCRRHVCGFFLGDFDISSGILFVSYLAVEESYGARKVPSRLARRAAKELKRHKRNLTGIAFELEPPSVGEPEHWLARFRIFKNAALAAGVSVKRVSLPYRQPRLSLWDPAFTERPLYLFYGRRESELGAAVSKAELSTLLDVLLNRWYASAFEDDPERDREFRSYLRSHYENTVADLAEMTPLSASVRPNLG